MNLHFFSPQFSSKNVFKFLTIILSLFLLKDWGGKEDFEIVCWKDKSSIAKWGRAPLGANCYDGSYRRPGETWQHQTAALRVAGGGITSAVVELRRLVSALFTPPRPFLWTIFLYYQKSCDLLIKLSPCYVVVAPLKSTAEKSVGR